MATAAAVGLNKFNTSIFIIISGEFESRPGGAYSIQHYEIKFVSDLWQVIGFLWVLQFPPPIKTGCHNIAEILLQVALNTITLTLTHIISGLYT